ncbi:MAG: response regulator transcription factor [Dehalococcoidales bacterium]|nr:response regulator transcription factor [Dehalococcoidales bacterium]
MQTILVVDDESNIIELARLYLERDGYKVESAANGREAISKQKSVNPDLIILDLMLPDIDGFEVCRQIRAKSAIPILMLTARKEDVDKIIGLELGADDYLTKPFNPRELAARVKAVLRRYQTGATPREMMEIGNLRIDLPAREVTVAGKPVALRVKEFDLLAAFAQNIGIVLSREKLLEIVWGYDYYGETRTVDVHVKNLRDKLSASDVSIETFRGTGYKMSPARSTG